MKPLAYCLLGMAVLVLAGCGESGPPTATVTGTVLLDGDPVEGATVTFMGPGASRVAAGVTDAQGKFSLMMDGKEGAAIGDNQVAVSKIEKGSAPTVPTTGEDGPPDLTKGPPPITDEFIGKNLLPQKYQSPATSGLSFPVKEGTNDFKIELTKK